MLSSTEEVLGGGRPASPPPVDLGAATAGMENGRKPVSTETNDTEMEPKDQSDCGERQSCLKLSDHPCFAYSCLGRASGVSDSPEARGIVDRPSKVEVFAVIK